MAYTLSFPVTQEKKYANTKQFEDALMTAKLATPNNDLNTTRIGTSIDLKYPIQLLSQDSLESDPAKINSIIQRIKTLKVIPRPTGGLPGTVHNVPIQIGAEDFTWNVDADSYSEFWDTYITGLTLQLGGDANGDVLREADVSFAQIIGNPFAPMSGLDAMQQITAQFSAMGLNSNRMGQKYLAMSPFAFSSLQVPYASYFNQNFNSPILKKNLQAVGGNFSGIDVYVDQQIGTHTNGLWATAGGANGITVASFSQTGDITAPYTILNLTGLTAATTINAGDLIYIGAITPVDTRIRMVDPQYKFPISPIKTFRVVSATTAAGGGTATINVFPPLVPSGASGTNIGNSQQNVARNVAVNDVITLFGSGGQTYVKNLCWVKSALVFANPPLRYGPGPESGGKDGNQIMALSPWMEKFKQKIGESGLMLNFDIMSGGDSFTALNSIIGRTATASAGFEGYAFFYASSV